MPQQSLFKLLQAWRAAHPVSSQPIVTMPDSSTESVVIPPQLPPQDVVLPPPDNPSVAVPSTILLGSVTQMRRLTMDESALNTPTVALIDDDQEPLVILHVMNTDKVRVVYDPPLP